MERIRDVGVVRKPLQGLRTFAVRSPLSAAWGVVAALIILVAIAAPVVAPVDPLKPDLARLRAAPGSESLFGTDYLGRDMLSRVIYGARVSLFVGVVAVLLGTTAGALWGLASGYVAGKFDLLSQRFLDVLMSFPSLILAMALAMALGAGLSTVVVAIAVTRVPFGARVIRSVALTVKEMPYVDSARSVGASPLRIIALHIAPQCIAPYIVLATTQLGAAMITEASLSFLGVGIPPPTQPGATCWGRRLLSGRPHGGWWSSRGRPLP